jgi:hypothetical protein
MARKNTALMLGAAAGGVGLLWFLFGRKRVSAPRDASNVHQMSYDELVAHTLKAVDSPERAAWDKEMLDLAVDAGLDLTTASAGEIEAAMAHQEKLAGDAIIRAAKDAAYVSTQDFSAYSKMTAPPQGTIDRAIAYVKAIDPNVKVLDQEGFTVLHEAGKLPAGTILVFFSSAVTRPIQSGGGRGFVLMSAEELVKRLSAAQAATGVAGMGDYVQMPYSGMGFGALYGSKGGSGATGLGF